MFLVDSKAGELHAQIFDIGQDKGKEVNGGAGSPQKENGNPKRTEIK